MKKYLLLFSLLVSSVCAMGQAANKPVSGIITDASTGQPLAGVYVEAYGDPRFTAMTDALGHYELKVPDHVTSLGLRVDGYQFQQKRIAADNQTTDAQLYSNQFSADYSRTTGATVSHSAQDFQNSSAQTIDPFISQRLGADVRTISRGGNIGMGNAMFMGGINSFQSNAQPLVVVDGVITDMQYNRSMLHDGYFNNMLANISVEDIERVTVLKNGTAIYGAKAANGVLLIETKRNKSMATKIDVTVNGRFELTPTTPDMLSADDYRLYATELLANQTADVAKLGFVQSDPNYYYYSKYHNNTDWKKQTYHNAFVSNYGINVQGGDDVANYNLSVGYSMGNSTLRENDFTRFNMRLNSDIVIFRSLKARFDAAYSDVNRKLRDDGTPLNTSYLATAPGFLGLAKAPFLSPYAYDLSGHVSGYLADADDYLNDVYGSDLSMANPKAILKYGDGKNRNQHGNRTISFSVTPRYEFNKHLVLSEHFNFSLVNTNENYYLPINGVPRHKVEGLGFNTYVDNQASSLAARQNSIQSDTRLAWHNLYADRHDISLFGGMRYLSQSYKLNGQVGYNTGNDKTPNMGNSLSYKSTDGADDKAHSITWYGQADYNYAQRYYLSAGLSAESSSRFGKDADGLKLFDVVWGLFPSVNAAWVVTNESWMSHAKGIDYLRLNLGFDVTGNDDIDYTASRTYFIANLMMGGTVDGKSIGNIGNTSLKWETTRRLTAGLEGNFFSNRLNLRFNYFKSWTSGLLSLHPLAYTSGLAESWGNDGKLRNEGFDAAFNVKLLAVKNFAWEAGASLGHYVNKVTALPDNNRAIETTVCGATVLTQVGQPVGLFYGYKTQGVLKDKAAADNAGLYFYDETDVRRDFAAGDMRFLDRDGNHEINEADRVVIGNPNPDIYGNIYTRMAYKHWNLSATFNYSLGNDVFNYQRMVLEGGRQFYNQTTAMNNRWTTEGQITDMPRINYGDPMGNSRFSDRWIEDGSYLRLANVTLSYEIPITSTYLQGITLWASADNLFTLTHYLGSDPSCSLGSGVLAQGIDRGLLGETRSFSLGVKINL